MRKDYEDALAKALISVDPKISTRDVIKTTAADVGFTEKQALNTLEKWRQLGYYETPDGTDLDLGGFTEDGLKFFMGESATQEPLPAQLTERPEVPSAFDLINIEQYRSVEIILAAFIIEENDNACSAEAMENLVKTARIDPEDVSAVLQYLMGNQLLEEDTTDRVGRFTAKGLEYCRTTLGIEKKIEIPTPSYRGGKPSHCPSCGNTALSATQFHISCRPCGWSMSVAK